MRYAKAMIQMPVKLNYACEKLTVQNKTGTVIFLYDRYSLRKEMIDKEERVHEIQEMLILS